MSKIDTVVAIVGAGLILYIYARSYIELGMWSRHLPEMDFREFHKLMVENNSGESE